MYRKRDVDRFVAECLHPDGVLLIQFLKEHAGGRVAFELTNKLLELYTTQEVGPDYKVRSIRRSYIAAGLQT